MSSIQPEYGVKIIMKIRLGFVSNSSSSSFCIYGVAIHTDTELAQTLRKLKFEDFPSWIFFEDSPIDDENLYIGREWSTIADDETGADFKNTVQKGLKQLGITKKCITIQEAWYNG